MSNIFHAGVKGMKWKKHTAVDPMAEERQIFNEIMMGQYTGPMSAEDQAKFVKERFELEQKVGSGVKKNGGTFFQMSNDELKDYLDSSAVLEKKVAEVDSKKKTAAKKKVTDTIAKNEKKIVPWKKTFF